MAFLGKEIKLVGKSHKGKNRIREHGETWFVLAETERVLFSSDKSGPWLFIAPPGKTMNDKASRWVHGISDIDFEVKKI